MHNVPYQVLPANRHAIAYVKTALTSSAGTVGLLVPFLDASEAFTIVPAKIADAQVRRFSQALGGCAASAVLRLHQFLVDCHEEIGDVVIQDLWQRPTDDVFVVGEGVNHQIEKGVHYFCASLSGSGSEGLTQAIEAKASTRTAGFVRPSLTPLDAVVPKMTTLFISAYEGEGFLVCRWG